jgi:SAM-dependent methyltransferase
MMSAASDRWKTGSTYEDFMGRWSRRLAPRFLSWLRVPGDAHWLDVGCGTGALTHAICENADPASVVGCDPAEPFIEYARQLSGDGRASFAVAGIGSLPNRTHGYGSVTSLFALNFFPDPKVALDEMRSLTAGGGTISACVWDYAGRMEFLRRFWDVASAEDPKARELDEGKRFPVCHPEELAELFRVGDLREVRCDAIEIPTQFSSFDDYWRPFLGGTGPAPSYIASLEADRRIALAGKLERTLPRRSDGTIALIARAWAVRGTAS